MIPGADLANCSAQRSGYCVRAPHLDLRPWNSFTRACLHFQQDMESSLALATEEGPLARPATTEITSPDAGTWSAMALPSSPPTETTWKAPSGTSSSAQGSQFSPANYALDLCTDASSIPATARSASSPFTDRWSMGYADQDQGDEYALWPHPDQGSHDAQPMPKLEPLDDDVDLSEVKLAPSTPSPLSDGSQTQQRRPRGRPRKNSSSVAASATKVTKGRSKTGCITCRKRKKCDEAKPRCTSVGRQVIGFLIEPHR